MSLASSITVAISMMILGFALLLVLNADYLASKVESDLEISVFIKDDVTRDAALALENELKDIPGVDKLTFVTKEEALQELEVKFGEDADILAALGGTNPLPDSYYIKASQAEMVPALSEALAKVDGVEKVRYGQGMVERLLAVTKWMRQAGFVAIVAISIASVFLIATTVRITVFARRKEVGIMKYVGAANWYIRLPFFIEGMLIGLFGSLTAVASLSYAYSILIKNMALSLAFIPLISDQIMLYKVFGSLVLMGTGLGALGSAVSVHRFLKV